MAFIIDISNKLIDFKQKLEREPRVVLSAGFGDGKTYFLKRFSEKYQDDYHFFTIYPAQYVIGTNEAIFEYIKRDLLYQLVEQGIFSEKLDLEGLLREMMEDIDITEVLSFFLSKPVAKILGNAVNRIKTLYKKVDSHTLKSSSYLNSFMSARGGLYENDAYTCIIRKCFEKMRAEDNKQIVLVIEDLDRIDPGSIFSILNVFGSHFDRHYVVGGTEQENKFGVDRLVTVMDYNNIKLLYNRHFGEDEGESNFEGYISKYICSEPFYYSIRQEARRLLEDKLYSSYGFSAPSDTIMKARISKKMEKMTIRDLERLFNFDPKSVLRNPDKGIEINGIVLSPDSPIVHMQAYRVFFGVEYNPTRYDEKTPKLKTEVEYFAPLFILKEQRDSIEGIPRYLQYGEHYFVVQPQLDSEKSILGFQFKNTTSFVTPVLRMNEISDYADEVDLRLWEVEKLFEPYFYYSPPLEGVKESESEDFEL